MLIYNSRISGENNCRIFSCQSECDFIPVKCTEPAEFESSDVACWHHSLI